MNIFVIKIKRKKLQLQLFQKINSNLIWSGLITTGAFVEFYFLDDVIKNGTKWNFKMFKKTSSSDFESNNRCLQSSVQLFIRNPAKLGLIFDFVNVCCPSSRWRKWFLINLVLFFTKQWRCSPKFVHKP